MRVRVASYGNIEQEIVVLSLVVLGHWAWLAFAGILKMVFYSALSSGIYDAAMMIMLTFALFQTEGEVGKQVRLFARLNEDKDEKNYKELLDNVKITLIFSAIFYAGVPLARKVLDLARNSRLGRYIEDKVRRFIGK